MGLLVENLAAATLHNLALQTGVRLHHWRSGRDEVDFVLDHPGRPLAFEVSTASRHATTGLRAFRHRHARFSDGCYLVTPDAPVRRPTESPTGVGSLPLDRFLVAVGRQAEAAFATSLTAGREPEALF